MAVHKLIDWEFEEDPFVLIAIHSTVEPYRMAYLINKYVKLGFNRTALDQDILQTAYSAQYPVYKHFDADQNAFFYLIPNKYWGLSNEKPRELGLFEEDEVTKVKTILIKEHPSVDFLIKVEKDEDSFPLKKLVHALGEIPQIISVYQLDTYTIKQQDYLIFE